MQTQTQDKRPDLFEEETIDYRAIAGKLIRRWYIFAVAVFFSLVLAFLYTRFSMPRYKAHSTMFVKDDANSWLKGGGNELTQGFGLFSGGSNMQNEIVIMQSYSLLYKTLRRLKLETSYYGQPFLNGKRELYKQSPFLVQLDTSHPQVTGVSFDIELKGDESFVLKCEADEVWKYNYMNNEYLQKLEGFNFSGEFKFGEIIENSDFKFSVILNPDVVWEQEDLDKASFSFTVNSLDYLVKLTQSTISVSPINKETSIVQLTLEANNVVKAIDILDELGAVFLERNLEKKNEIAVNTIKYIDSQIDEIRDSLRYNEMKLQNFRKNKKVMDLSFQANMLVERIQKLEEEEAMSLVRLKYYEYLKQSIGKSDSDDQLIAPSTMGVQDQVLTGMVLELSKLISEKRSAFSVGPNSPVLRKLDLRIKSTKESLLESTRNAIESEKINLENIKERLAVIEDAANQLPQTQRELIGIERLFTLNNQLFTFLLQKRSEAQIARAANTPDNEVIDRARMFGNKPVSPKKKIIYLAALFFGLVLPAAGILLQDAISDKVKERADIERISAQIPIIGTVVKNDKLTNTVIIDYPKSPVAESFRALRTSLQFYGHKGKKLSLLVTSSLSGEGKTFTAINVASVYALYGKTVLVGLDLRKPRIYDDFNIGNLKGASTYLSGRDQVKDVIQKTTLENLDVITSGPVPPNPVELIDSPMAEAFINELKELYDYVIIDTAPIGLVTDAYLLMRHIDASLYVVRRDYTHKAVLKHILTDIEQKRVRNMSIVFNDVDARNYGYGYGYYEDEATSVPWYKRILQR